MTKRLIALNLVLVLLLALLPVQVFAAEIVLTENETLELTCEEKGTVKVIFTPEYTGLFRLEAGLQEVIDGVYTATNVNVDVYEGMDDAAEEIETEINHISSNYEREVDAHLIAGKTYQFEIRVNYPPAKLQLKITGTQDTELSLEKATETNPGKRTFMSFTAPEDGIYSFVTTKAVTVGMIDPDNRWLPHSTGIDSMWIDPAYAFRAIELDKGQTCTFVVEKCDSNSVIVRKVDVIEAEIGESFDLQPGQAIQINIPAGQYLVTVDNGVYEPTPIESEWNIFPDFYLYGGNFQESQANCDGHWINDKIWLYPEQPTTYYIFAAGHHTCADLEVIPYWDDPFEDVSYRDWFYEAVWFAYEAQLFNGTSDTTFSPNMTMTRGMLVTVLYRMLEDYDVSGVENPFTDVPEGRYYTDAILWASDVGVVNGMGNGKFEPDKPVTREQMATILMRFSDWLEIDTSVRGDLSGYTDQNEIHDYAVEAMQWAVGTGLIQGMTTTDLQPQNSATRAQVATILMRYLLSLVGEE